MTRPKRFLRMQDYKEHLTGKTFKDRLVEGGVGRRVFLLLPGSPISADSRNAYMVESSKDIQGEYVIITFVDEHGHEHIRHTRTQQHLTMLYPNPEFSNEEIVQARQASQLSEAVDKIQRASPVEIDLRSSQEEIPEDVDKDFRWP